MDERLVTAFVAVADEGTVSEAARTLAITQPALTRQLQTLQQRTGLQLFQRHGVHLVLTAAGAEFLPVARRLQAEHRRAAQFARTLATGRFSEVRLAAPGTTLIDVVIPFVATLGADRPRASVVETPLDSTLREAVHTSDLVVMPATPPDGVVSIPLVELPVWAYVAASHPLAAGTEVELADLVQQSLVLTSRAFKSRRVFDGALEVSGLSMSEYVETNSGRVAQALVATGSGVAVVTEDPTFDLVPLRIRSGAEALSVWLHAAWRRDHYAAQQVRSVAEDLRDFVRSRYPESSVD